MREKYQQLLAAGKAKKVALTAIMRKLILLANSLLKADRKWVQHRA
jgi:transposase